jgi:acyl-CoA dehydrogenase family member 9
MYFNFTDNFISENIQASIQILSQLRMNVGIMAVSGVMRPIINKLTKYFIDTRVQKIHLKDLDIIKETIGSLAASCYGLEAMIYLTAGLKDIYENQDLDVECAMIKNYAIEALTQFITSPMHSIGALAMLKDEGYEKLICDAYQLMGIEEPVQMLKQYIALSGMNHAGKEFNSMIKKKRNILDHPMFIFNRFKTEISIRDPKRKMQIWHHLHPSLANSGNYLETSVYRLRAVIEILLGRYGPQIFDHGIECAQVADIATQCYAMFAASTRSSRSYCIGLRNGDQEMYLANAFCFDLSQKVYRTARAIDDGEYGTASHVYKVVGEKLIETKKYHFEHPTERNF